MKDPNYTYYRIDLGEIWEYEANYFLEGNSSDSFISNLKTRYEIFVINAMKYQQHQNSHIWFTKFQIRPFTSTRDYDKGDQSDKDYFVRHLRKYQECSTIEDYVRLSYFMVQNDFFEQTQTIYATPQLSDFEYWFSLKLRQYTKGLKYIGELCEYNLTHLYGNDFQEFKKLLKILIHQYKDDLITESVVLFVNQWIEEYEIRLKKSKKALYTKIWKYDIFNNDDVFTEIENLELDQIYSSEEYHYIPIDNSELRIAPYIGKDGTKDNNSKSINFNTTYRTFYLSILDKNKQLFNSQATSFMELNEIFDELKKDFIDPQTNYNQFIAIFQDGKILPENKIIWTGTLHELYWFIKCIENEKLCTHLIKLDKWLIAQKCFNYQIRRGDKKGTIIQILNYLQIADAKGLESSRTNNLKQIVSKLKSICNGTPTGVK
jgi:hypothetical protein